jgi:hypothetical protein
MSKEIMTLNEAMNVPLRANSKIMMIIQTDRAKKEVEAQSR